MDDQGEVVKYKELGENMKDAFILEKEAKIRLDAQWNAKAKWNDDSKDKDWFL